jgi:nucleotide-binding universal stress UspA family protein
MVKDIVVNLGVRGAGDTVGDYAISVARTLEAHITGIAFAYDPTIPISGLGYVRAQIVDETIDNKAAAKAVMDRFNDAGARAGVLTERRRLPASIDRAADQFARIARRFDLAIVGQADPEAISVDATIAEAALFESGRPIIMVPYVQKAPLKLNNVMVCWDGSRSATRAIADAMPFLAKAARVEIVIVTNERGKQNEIEGADMGQHLARHGFKVDVRRMTRGDVDIADMLLSNAADSGADFMVMGGYGHSRLREFALGGVTRSILHSMTVPTLMSH